MHARGVSASICALVLTTTSCAEVESGDLRTSEIEAFITVTAANDGVRVESRLGDGGLSDVLLLGEDRLTASAGGEPVTLLASVHELINTVSYHAGLPGLAEPGTEVTVALERGQDDTDAPASTVVLPEAVIVSAPGLLQVSRSNVLAVNEAPGNYQVDWLGTCVVARTRPLELGDAEPVVLQPGSIKLLEGQESCPIQLSVTRVLVGELDEAFKGGRITGERVTTLTLTVQP